MCGARVLVALGCAAWRGGARELVRVGIASLMVLLGRLLVSTGQVEYHSVDLGLLVIDLIGSAATIALALLAHRVWPMIVAVLHVLPLLAHISRALDVSMKPISYLPMQEIGRASCRERVCQYV